MGRIGELAGAAIAMLIGTGGDQQMVRPQEQEHRKPGERGKVKKLRKAQGAARRMTRIRQRRWHGGN